MQASNEGIVGATLRADPKQTEPLGFGAFAVDDRDR
jgi:hypothetical protein